MEVGSSNVEEQDWFRMLGVFEVKEEIGVYSLRYLIERRPLCNPNQPPRQQSASLKSLLAVRKKRGSRS